jgi:glycosyltransferase 2 family protein
MRHSKAGQAKPRLFFLLRVLLSLSLVVVLLRFIDVTTLIDALAEANPLLVLLALAWLFIDRIIMAYRWRILLCAKSISIPLLQLTKIYFIGSFWGLFLPSNLAPDVVRVYLAARTWAHGTSDMFSSVLIDRVIGLAVLMGLAGGAVLTLALSQQTILKPSASVIILAASLCFPLMFWLWPKLPAPEAFSCGFAGRVGEQIRRLYASCHSYRQARASLVWVILLAFVSHAGAILMVYALSMALSLQVGAIYFFVFIPLITVSTMLPISLGGIGVQEGAFAYFFSLAGMPLAGALALSLLLRVLSIVASLPGGLLSLSQENHRPA